MKQAQGGLPLIDDSLLQSKHVTGDSSEVLNKQIRCSIFGCEEFDVFSEGSNATSVS
jgi:hypothetical protein